MYIYPCIPHGVFVLPKDLLVRPVSGLDRCAGLRGEHHRRLRGLAADAEPLQVSRLAIAANFGRGFPWKFPPRKFGD